MDYEQEFHSNSEEPSSRIIGILAEDEKAYHNWIAHHPEGGLNLPIDALRFLIPPRLLELAHSSNAVTLRIADQTKNNVRFYVVESTSDSSFSVQELKHWSAEEDLSSGILLPTDVIYSKIDLELVGGEGYSQPDLFVNSYDDREDIREKGVATSFYRKLREFASEEGIPRITGQNNDINSSFFVKSGRVRLTDLSRQEQTLFHHKYGDRIKDPENFTIDMTEE